MDNILHGSVKKSRTRRAPNKKWTEEEHEALLKFLQRYRNFEKPTAQLYYRKFLRETGINTDWSLVRYKVRNMRTSYSKAKSLEQNKEAGSFYEEELSKRICPYFTELEDIFGRNEMTFEQIEIKSEDTIYNDNSETDGHSHSTIHSLSPEFVGEEEDIPVVRAVSKTVPKGVYSRTAVTDILQVHADFFKLRKEKFEIEVQQMHKEIALKERDLALRREQFEFEKEKIFKELELKEKEIRSQAKLRVMELEMKERIAIKELEMKERLAGKDYENLV